MRSSSLFCEGTVPLRNAPPETADVLIVGAGPTGLTLACALAARHVRFVLVDRLPAGLNTSRAAVIHARTLEVLEELHVADHLRDEGVVVPRFVLRDRDRELAVVRFDGLPTKHPYTLMVPQQTTEAILLERLRELGGDVVRPFELRSLEQDAGGVSAEIGTNGKPPRAVRVRYLVGADGMNSRVREAAGVGFRGAPYDESFVLADVRMRSELRPDEVLLFLSPEGLVVVAGLPGGRHRIVAMMDDAPEHPSVEDVQRLMDARGPRSGAVRIEEVAWSSRFRVHHRLADRYRVGRVLLAGDAAHVHSPAGGQGMNTGIQDGMALGHALAAVLGGGGESPLDDYEETRRPAAERVVAFTDRLTRMATLRSGPARAVRNALLSVTSRFTPLPRWLATELSGLRG